MTKVFSIIYSLLELIYRANNDSFVVTACVSSAVFFFFLLLELSASARVQTARTWPIKAWLHRTIDTLSLYSITLESSSDWSGTGSLNAISTRPIKRTEQYRYALKKRFKRCGAKLRVGLHHLHATSSRQLAEKTHMVISALLLYCGSLFFARFAQKHEKTIDLWWK